MNWRTKDSWELNFREKHATKSRCEALARDAKFNKCWINIKDQWLTPEEFIIEANSQKLPNYPGYTNFLIEDIKIKNPYDMLKRLNARLDYFINVRDELQKKVDGYYSKR